MKKLLFCVLALAFLNLSKSYAQIGMAVAVDKNNNEITYSIGYGNSIWNAQASAQNNLKTRGYTNVVVRGGSELNSGFFVIIKSTFEIETFNFKGNITGYGIGVSSSSYNDALNNAIENLFNNTQWTKNKGYQIVQQSTF